MTETNILLHWAYVAVMAASAIAILSMARNPKGVPQYKYLIHAFVVIWSGLVYSAIAFGQGTVEVGGETVYFARYLDWVISTPLLLLSLVLTGKYTLKLEGSITAGLLGSQVIMILTGLVADLSPSANRWFWYIAGCVALLVVFRLMWRELYAKAKIQGPELTAAYKASAVFLSVQWLLYPLAWALGTPGLGVFDPLLTSVLFIVLPIVSKAGFAFYNLSKLRALPDYLHRAASDPRKATEVERNPPLTATPV
ncbi:bacteriorhodopsin [Neolewinella xylanilytica]|uniref:Bacteriorhodopsin n=1 Tax=Neolewinella xylanilytica TaxID=1514080 RepID=A0A2S6I2L1_9BACT|nr:bacteriorhodopsin [Neolewinella xylanilytica]PPK85422.1 bacteriorhodopsin [Neolewinella xylanilytica]